MPRQANSRTSRARVVAAERRSKALELRGEGQTYEGIGRSLGVTRQRAHQVVDAALHDLATREEDSVRALRLLEFGRLEDLQDAFENAALGGDVAAARILLRVAERRARLIGTDLQTRSPLIQVAAIGQVTTALGRAPRDKNQFEFARRLWRAESIAEREEIIDESPESFTAAQRTALREVTFPPIRES